MKKTHAEKSDLIGLLCMMGLAVAAMMVRCAVFLPELL